MKLLVIGGGGREYAVADGLATDPRVKKVFAAPGNAGMAEFAEPANIKADDVGALLKFAIENKPDLTYVGPEAPLMKDIAGKFQANGLAIVAPSELATRYTEGSKINCQQMCQENGVAIAPGIWCRQGQLSKAYDYIGSTDDGWAIKADGFASGKGVILAKDRQAAKIAAQRMMIDGILGNAGKEIVIQKFLPGNELSFHVLVNGDEWQVLEVVQDYKQAPDGRMTGGLGGKRINVSPAIIGQFNHRILRPTLEAFRKLGIVYKGVLYAGCILSDGLLYLLEYNSRFGDPEVQVILSSLKSPAVLDMLTAMAFGGVNDLRLEWKERRTVLVVGCSAFYPGDSYIDQEVWGLDRLSEFEGIADLVHAGTGLKDGNLVNKGGRVFNFLGYGDTDEEAAANAYRLARTVGFNGMWYLEGIGTRI